MLVQVLHLYCTLYAGRRLSARGALAAAACLSGISLLSAARRLCAAVLPATAPCLLEASAPSYRWLREQCAARCGTFSAARRAAVASVSALFPLTHPTALRDALPVAARAYSFFEDSFIYLVETSARARSSIPLSHSGLPRVLSTGITIMMTSGRERGTVCFHSAGLRGRRHLQRAGVLLLWVL